MVSIKNIFLWPINKFRSITNEISNRNPRDKCMLITTIAVFVLRPTGCSFIATDYTHNWLTVISAIAIIDVISFALYGVYYSRHEFLLALQALMTLGVSVPNCFPYYRVLADTVQYRSLNNFGTDYTFANKDKDLQVVLAQRAEKFLSNTLKLFLLLFASLGAFALYPAYAFFILNEKVLIMRIILPFVDPDSSKGFYINSFNILFISFIGVLGNVGIELSNCCLINNLRVGVDVVSFTFDKLDADLKTGKKIDMKMKGLFRNIFMQVQDLDRYIIAINKFFYWKFLIQPLILTFSISGAIVCILMIDYKSGYGWVVFTYLQVLILCFMGSEVKQANEQLQVSLYGVSWYLLPLKEQKMLAHLLNRLQNGTCLTIGPFADLDFQITAKITNTIFGYTTMLKSFF